MKRVKGLVVLFICILLLSGCVKETISMDIKSDKSMTLSGKVLVIDEYKESFDETYDSSKLEKNGFKVTTTKENGYSGYILTKEFTNIDDLSKNNGIQIDISGIFQDEVDFSKLFTRTTSFFMDTYKASFLFANDETAEEDSGSNLDTDNEVIEDSIITTDDEEEGEEQTSSINMGDDLNALANSLTSTMEFKYIVTLPSKPASHNASDVSEDGKTLTWNLATSEASNIQYEFSILNMTHIYMVGGGVLALIIIIVVLMIVIKKKKASKETLIHKEFDPSIAPQVEGVTPTPVVEEQPPVLPEMEGPQVVENLEYTLPEEETKNHVEEVDKGPQFTEGVQPEMQTPEAAPQVGPAPVMEQSVQEANNVMTPEVEPTPQPVNLYNNNRPDFVRDTEPKAFVHDDIPDTHKPLPNLNPGGSMDLDVPDATALSDMNN